ncbi:unnamed protein product [Durusdinium trenchii]|uniref:Uncharacterized protein n=2 Tax=Durusdinium trenchii TaxID=1381693 RepID=A0ABP0J296_9DINO
MNHGAAAHDELPNLSPFGNTQGGEAAVCLSEVAGSSNERIDEVDLEGIDIGLDKEDEWFQPDIAHQPSFLATMRVAPGVSITDLNTGEMRFSEMQRYEGQMSRLEYLALTGYVPEVPPEDRSQVHEDGKTLDIEPDGRVAEIREQFQALSLLHPPMRLPPRSRPSSAVSRGTRGKNVPQPKDKVMGGRIIANKELLQKYFGQGD